VKNFLALAGKGALDGVRVASIGPVTSETCRAHGVEVAVEAEPHTIDGLVAAILQAVRSTREQNGPVTFRLPEDAPKVSTEHVRHVEGEGP